MLYFSKTEEVDLDFIYVEFEIVSKVKHTPEKLFFLTISDKWSPALQIRTVLLSIQALLSAPNPDDQ